MSNSDIDEIRKLLANQVAQTKGDARASAGGPQIPAMEKMTPTGPHPDEGKELEIHGVAENAMEGAVVVTDEGASYVVEGLERWDDDVAGERVVVTGTMRRKKLAPDPGTAADGGATHGARGKSSVLTDPTWKREP